MLTKHLFALALLLLSGSVLAEENPMGKTWVIFIENSSYQSFASIEGPASDVGLMKKALAPYDIEKIVHKKNMTKTQMQQFFSSELKKLVQTNGVQSIMVWYTGHGKFINDIGYWIPVDADRDNEGSYFDISSLKSSMQSYNQNIKHTLMVTDACESGSSFYQAMRDPPTTPECGSSASTLKSSQVFSSSGYDLAVDNSQFTQTFASMLLGNTDACIPVEKIVKEVTKMVVIKNRQRPKFGTIPGFEHKNGTYFFIKK